jgi:predicted RND superfamily exporter protein
VGTAATETSIAIFCGFAVLGLAEFEPTRDFGLLTAVAMLVALAADLLIFPLFVRVPGALPPVLPVTPVKELQS